LNGKKALAFARDRHDVPGGDLGRSANQGRLLLAALAKFHKVFSKDPSSMLRWVGIGLRNVSTDLSVGELARLAFTAAEIPVSNVKNVVVPGSTGSSGGASVVYISGSASSIYSDMRRDGVIGR
jgi:anionic cell wall polymer biosynthesis LytR-Cps2A-Psr (LCP) family protein